MWDHYGKKYPVGRIITTTEAKKLINEGRAEKYEGPYPPRKKMKMDLKDLKIK